MITNLYHDPFTRTLLMESDVEILDLAAVVPKCTNETNASEIAAYHRYKDFGIRTGVVRFKDGSLMRDAWFNEADIQPSLSTSKKQ